MEMWKTAAPPMENRYSRPDGKAAGFPTARKHRFPQLRKHDRFHTFHSAYYGENERPYQMNCYGRSSYSFPVLKARFIYALEKCNVTISFYNQLQITKPAQ